MIPLWRRLRSWDHPPWEGPLESACSDGPLEGIENPQEAVETWCSKEAHGGQLPQPPFALNGTSSLGLALFTRISTATIHPLGCCS